MDWEPKEKLGWPTDQKVIDAALVKLQNAWPELKPGFLALVEEELHRYPDQCIREGIALLIRTDSMPPRVATIVESIKAVWPKR